LEVRGKFDRGHRQDKTGYGHHKPERTTFIGFTIIGRFEGKVPYFGKYAEYADLYNVHSEKQKAR
jgi:hypothetical protein